ncbi:MAG: DUF2460 domain-containing protein [Pseudomonadota bacterium]
MSFDEVRFPTALSFGSSGGPERRTDVVSLANGFEERNTPWAHSRRRYDAGVGMRSLADLEAVVSFFEERRGALRGFRWKDWADYKSCGIQETVAASDQEIGAGDGVTTEFQLVKTYGTGATAYARPISKPVFASVRVALDGEPQTEGPDYTTDTTTGLITFTTAPGAGVDVTAGFEFDVPVRFDTDGIDVSVAGFKAGEIPSVPVIEVRL